jgi:hypothetical protein
MRWHELLCLFVLMLIAMGLAAGNLWFAVARSTIPLALDTTVQEKEIRPEKHPGKDDVYLLWLGGARQIQVDRNVYDQVRIGDPLLKQPWSATLKHGDETVELSYSEDYSGMLKAMPACLLALLATGIVVLMARIRPAAHPSSS